MSELLQSMYNYVGLLLKFIWLHIYVHANEQSIASVFLCLRVHYSLLFSSEIILKQIFASGSLNIVE